jgi:hypothetical protein
VRRLYDEKFAEVDLLVKSTINDISGLKEKVAKESEKATYEIQRITRNLAIKLDSVAGDINLRVWFHELPKNFIAVLSAQHNQSGIDARIGGQWHGAFSYFFQKVLLDQKADQNNDGQVSLGEGVLFSKKQLKANRYTQVSFIGGEDTNFSLFPLSADEKNKKLGKNVKSFLIGVNDHKDVRINLKGAVNDIIGFRNLLKTRMGVPNENIIFLTNKNASLKTIQDRLEHLKKISNPDDLLIVYFSGHSYSTKDRTGKSPTGLVKLICPWDFGEGTFLLGPDLIAKMK